MKINIILAITMVCLLSVGCSKKDETLVHSASPVRQQTHPIMEMEGEDDRPILMHRTQKNDLSAIANATVTLINGSDTLVQYSDANGQCTFSLPRLGTWNVTVTHTGFTAIHGTINIVDSLTERTDYMTEE